jgi:protein-disulfide isomerase
MDQSEQNLSKKERQEAKKEEKENRRIQEQNKKRLTSIILWSFITLFVGGTIALMIALASKNPGTQYVDGSVKAADTTDWVKGAPLADATVTIIEYGDFECPACALYLPIFKKLSQDFTNVSIVYRNFPLSQHANARVAAQAAHAAGLQGKFWEMHDMLYENQNFWSGSKTAESIFITYAEKLALDINKYKSDFASNETKNKITADYQSGLSAINGTPTFFLNGKKIQNPQNYEQFKRIVQEAGGTLK